MSSSQINKYYIKLLTTSSFAKRNIYTESEIKDFENQMDFKLNLQYLFTLNPTSNHLLKYRNRYLLTEKPREVIFSQQNKVSVIIKLSLLPTNNQKKHIFFHKHMTTAQYPDELVESW